MNPEMFDREEGGDVERVMIALDRQVSVPYFDGGSLTLSLELSDGVVTKVRLIDRGDSVEVVGETNRALSKRVEKRLVDCGKGRSVHLISAQRSYATVLDLLNSMLNGRSAGAGPHAKTA